VLGWALRSGSIGAARARYGRRRLVASSPPAAPVTVPANLCDVLRHLRQVSSPIYPVQLLRSFFLRGRIPLGVGTCLLQPFGLGLPFLSILTVRCHQEYIAHVLSGRQLPLVHPPTAPAIPRLTLMLPPSPPRSLTRGLQGPTRVRWCPVCGTTRSSRVSRHARALTVLPRDNCRHHLRSCCHRGLPYDWTSTGCTRSTARPAVATGPGLVPALTCLLC